MFYRCSSVLISVNNFGVDPDYLIWLHVLLFHSVVCFHDFPTLIVSFNQGGTVSPVTLRELMSHAMHFLMTSVTPQYEFWAPNPYYTNYIRHDGAHFKEDFQRNLGMSLDFLYHAWFQFLSLLSCPHVFLFRAPLSTAAPQQRKERKEDRGIIAPPPPPIFIPSSLSTRRSSRKYEGMFSQSVKSVK